MICLQYSFPGGGSEKDDVKGTAIISHELGMAFSDACDIFFVFLDCLRGKNRLILHLSVLL